MHPALIISSFCELKSKEVVNLCNGCLLGCISDIEFNVCTGEIISIILPGNGILASLSSKNRICIPWRDIERIGKDAVLVRFNAPEKKE
ncbi:MAG: YlmC/YmxH family sporulation protein [Clostridia bacterium]|nr:YlmC/YmxH family sporulation protein [Clostridia bacterium]MBQ9848575.1 YlmC/YmxH family sporulation protein [Clostridia bacterium]